MATCVHAASAIGPRGQCGASATSYASAIAAIFRISEMPPQCDISGSHGRVFQETFRVPADIEPFTESNRTGCKLGVLFDAFGMLALL